MEILKKYSCDTELNESISKMSTDNMASKIAALKAHAFSNANSGTEDANSISRNGVRSTNPRPGPSLDQNPGELDQNERQPHGKVKELVSLYNRASSKELQQTGIYNNEFVEDLASHSVSRSRASDKKSLCESLSEQIQIDCCSRPPFLVAKEGELKEAANVKDSSFSAEGLTTKISETPKVIITPADMEEDTKIEATNSAETNGEVEVVPSLLNNRSISETDSLSSTSSCSVDEFLTDEEATDEEISPCMDDRACKVRNESFFYVFRVACSFTYHDSLHIQHGGSILMSC